MRRSPRILSWRWGRVVVDIAPEPFRDVVLYPGGAHAWDWRDSGTGHRAGVQPSAVREIVDRGAHTVVISTGALGALRIAPETLTFLEQRGVAVHVLRTPAAVDRYNELAVGNEVGALIHSTC